MSRQTEYQAKLTSDQGIVRGRIPAGLIKELGGKAGDFLVITSKGNGSVTISVDRPKKTRVKK